MRLLPVFLLRLALLAAVFASAVLVVDYSNAGDPAFCGVSSGCFAVRTSGYAYLFGYIPLPVLGLVAFASLFGIEFVATTRIQRTVVMSICGIGSLFAAYLLYLQISVIGKLCPWCVTVDSSTIVAAFASLWVWFNATKDEASVRLPAKPSVPLAWLTAAIIAIAAPFVWGQFPANPPLSEAIKAEQVPDKLTIVGFTDFECPFCRRLHPAMHHVLDEHAGKIHFVRKMAPLPGHPGAEPAALVYLCTPEPLREAVADKLYTAPTVKLTPEDTIIIAASAGVDAGELSVCVKSPETKAKLEAEKKAFEDLGGHGLPFTFVGKRAVLGANAAGLEAAVSRELSGNHLSLPVWALFALVGAAFVAAIGVTIREDKRAENPSV